MGSERDRNVGPAPGSGINPHGLTGPGSAADHSQTPQRANANHPSSSSSSGSQSSSTRSNQQSKNFEFVLVTDNESRRQVRRHAMRQYMHQRRLDSIARLENSRVPLGGRTTRQNSSVSSVSSSSSRLEDVEEDAFSNPTPGSNSRTGEQLPQDKAKGPSRLLIPKLQKVKRAGSPSPILNSAGADPRAAPGVGGMQDPFHSYPIRVTKEDHELIQHFVVTYPSMMYKFVNSIANNPMMEIFKQFALHDDLPFQAMLAIASKHRAGVEGKADSVQSLTHKMRALQLMNERIQADSTGQHDGTIYAVATMAVIEKWSKFSSIEQMHFKGLSSMIRNRGGMRGMRASCPFLEKVLYWVDFSCASKAVIGTSLPWTGSVPDMPPASLDFVFPTLYLAAENTEDYDQLQACEDFLRFFRRLHEQQNLAMDQPSNLTFDDSPQRLKRFSHGTPLHSILTTLPDYDHGIRDIRFIDEYTCMACLFFLAVALYDSYCNSTNFDRYLDWLHIEITKLNPSSNPSITSILWLFLNNGGYPTEHPGDAGDRCWVVSRMVRIAKKLEWKRSGTVWDRLRHVLTGFITMQQDCALGLKQADAEALAARQRLRSHHGYFWDEDEMRELILTRDSQVVGGNVTILT